MAKKLVVTAKNDKEMQYLEAKRNYKRAVENFDTAFEQIEGKWTTSDTTKKIAALHDMVVLLAQKAEIDIHGNY